MLCKYMTSTATHVAIANRRICASTNTPVMVNIKDVGFLFGIYFTTPSLGNCSELFGSMSNNVVSSTDTDNSAVRPIDTRSVRSFSAVDGENRPIVAVMLYRLLSRNIITK
jgi:hypothetical protein